MKKLICLILCVIMTVCSLSMSASAVSANEGLEALQEQFDLGLGVMDFVYYSPVKNEKDTTKYPLVVWLHGNSSGDYPGHQLDNCSIAMWSSEEYQSRFKGTRGAFLFLPRFPTGSGLIAWECPTSTVKTSIDGFIKRFAENIDTSRIYIGGYSMGGKMVLRMASAYPSFFAAAFPLSPVYAPTNIELNSLVDMPIWFSWCKNDDYLSLDSRVVLDNWSYLMKNSNCKERCRLATLDGIYRPDYSYRGDDEIHNTWEPACYDYLMNDGKHYKDLELVDGTGKEITLKAPKGLIHWLSSQSLGSEDTQATGVFARLFGGIFSFFKSFIQAIFKPYL